MSDSVVMVAHLEREVSTRTAPIFLGRPSKYRFKRSNNRRIELRFDGLRQAKTGNTARHRLAVGAVGCHRIVRIRNGDYS